jgi:UDP-N-acetylglucosamine 4,6-dehydratase
VAFVLSSLALMRGGEIFIPKIPSMKVVDLAMAIGPGLPHKIIGMRPGEKLHEAMTTRFDTRNTLDLGDRYVIEPAFATWTRKSFREDGGISVAEDFEYRSDTNPDWLDAPALQKILKSS